MIARNSTTVDLIIKNAKIFFNNQIIEGGIIIDKGKITGIGKDSKLPPGDHTINIEGQLVIPGAIDIHAHLRDLNYRDKEDFYSGTCAAANGGITTVVDMPNTNPSTISSDLLEQKMNIARKKIVINTGFYAGIPNILEEITSLADHGVFGFKLYLSHSLSEFDIDDLELLRKLFQKIKQSNCPILIHAERKKDIEEIQTQIRGVQLSPQEIYLQSHSEVVEKKAIEFILKLTAQIGSKTHICHVSTVAGMDIIREMKEKEKNITAEVTPHHLFLNTNDLLKYGALAKMLPPLRAPHHQAGLWQGLNDGTIDILATDHAPHMQSEKDCNFSQAANGIPGFETVLPLMFTAMHEEKITLTRLIQIISENPAKFLNLSSKGRIAVGFDADLTVIDLKKSKVIKAEDFHSKAKFSPFNGREVKGIPTMTIVNGKIVMKDGEIMVPKGLGKILQRPLK
ncbi:MAG TPA: dihydroorotase family protein [Candidatus Deferrimicrobium sp.]|nr:dihydroorotase family protein [Candidatus Deferrimicrobium sp.]